MNKTLKTSHDFLHGLILTLLLGSVSHEVRAQDLRLKAGSDSGVTMTSEEQTHLVRSGDTLWDLCGEYLNSSWYWPKVWSYNPQLTNPHWIYPGNEVRFAPVEQQLPVEISQVTTIEEGGEDLSIPGKISDAELVQMVGSIQTHRVAADSVWMSQSGFLSKDLVQRSGQIVSSEEEAVLLSDFDNLYVKGDEAQLSAGERYAIYRVGRKIRHPISGKNFGYAVNLVGLAEVTRAGEKVSTARLVRAIRPVSRGDILAPLPKNYGRRVAPEANKVSLTGYVMETSGDILGPLGEYNLVFVDKGSKHGVVAGNTFKVYQRGDRYTKRTAELPDEVVATLMVMNVHEEASTAMVVVSAREISVGDRVEMTSEGVTAQL
ncbi:MAG: LysM peptidoglycan-binding domain-containing protein [Myxococcales bacterium]|nr:LysM peptidoglycan-binding domain-containing protein [Myxococcales bacterium]